MFLDCLQLSSLFLQLVQHLSLVFPSQCRCFMDEFIMQLIDDWRFFPRTWYALFRECIVIAFSQCLYISIHLFTNDEDSAVLACISPPLQKKSSNVLSNFQGSSSRKIHHTQLTPVTNIFLYLATRWYRQNLRKQTRFPGARFACIPPST